MLVGLCIFFFFVNSMFLKPQEIFFSFLKARFELLTVEGSLLDQCWQHMDSTGILSLHYCVHGPSNAKVRNEHTQNTKDTHSCALEKYLLH